MESSLQGYQEGYSDAIEYYNENITQPLRKELEASKLEVETQRTVYHAQIHKLLSEAGMRKKELEEAKAKIAEFDSEMCLFFKWCSGNGWSYVNGSFVNYYGVTMNESELLQIYKNRAITSPPANQ